MVKTTGRICVPRCDDVSMWVISARNIQRNTRFYSSVMMNSAVMRCREKSRGQATVCFPLERSCVMWGAVQWRGRTEWKKWKGSGSWTLSVDTLHHPPTHPCHWIRTPPTKIHSPRPPIYYIFVASQSFCMPVCLLNGGEMLPLHMTSETVEKDLQDTGVEICLLYLCV